MFSVQSNITIIITPCEFFISSFADGISMESEWLQFSPIFQNSSQYSGQA